jgi:hypothetical protein
LTSPLRRCNRLSRGRVDRELGLRNYNHGHVTRHVRAVASVGRQAVGPPYTHHVAGKPPVVLLGDRSPAVLEPKRPALLNLGCLLEVRAAGGGCRVEDAAHVVQIILRVAQHADVVLPNVALLARVRPVTLDADVIPAGRGDGAVFAVPELNQALRKVQSVAAVA